jgi:hypothetical protein
VGAIVSCATSRKTSSFYVEKLLAPHTFPKMEYELLSAVRDSLLITFGVTFEDTSSSHVAQTRQSIVIRNPIDMADWQEHKYGGPQPVYPEALNTKMIIFKLKVKI